jgi:hypothetical protein
LPDATPLADGGILVTGGFTNDDRQSSVALADLFNLPRQLHDRSQHLYKNLGGRNRDDDR